MTAFESPDEAIHAWIIWFDDAKHFAIPFINSTDGMLECVEIIFTFVQ